MLISIIGLGFVGSAILNTFSKLRKINDNINLYDKYKNIGRIEDTINSNIIFIALPTPYDDKLKAYNLSAIEETCNYLRNNNNLIVIKSTVLPGTCDELSDKYNLKIIHNPEFLSAKTANEDFENSNHVVLGKTKNINDDDIKIIKNFYLEYFPLATYNICNSKESELMKIFCNSFYAVKVEFFTELYLLSNKLDCSFNLIRDMMLENKWINPQHTNIPGSDGKISYGGMCFPKDTNALNEFMKNKESVNYILDATIKERNILRDD
jgi:UDPglucose 6-dehydrogenase